MEQPKTLPLKISWPTAMKILITVLKDGTEEGKEMAAQHLFELAHKLEQLNKETADEQDN